MSVKRILGMLWVVFSIILIFWFAASYFEVIFNNLGENPQYSFWNLFQILVENF